MSPSKVKVDSHIFKKIEPSKYMYFCTVPYNIFISLGLTRNLRDVERHGFERLESLGRCRRPNAFFIIIFFLSLILVKML